TDSAWARGVPAREQLARLTSAAGGCVIAGPTVKKEQRESRFRDYMGQLHRVAAVGADGSLDHVREIGVSD
ncbi:MAG: hypothetical protein WAV78_53130, partial [Xanthobacteraceae bacterium]